MGQGGTRMRMRMGMLAAVSMVLPAAAIGQTRTQYESGGEILIGRTAMPRETVKKLQMAARAVGCDPGPIDGVMGPQTQRALACVHAQSGPHTVLDTATAPLIAPSAAAAPAARPPAAAGNTTIIVVPTPPTGSAVIVNPPVPTVNSSTDSTISGRNSARDSLVNRPASPSRPQRPDTTRRP